MKSRIVELAKSKGLDIAEESVAKLVELLFEVVEIVVEETETELDDMIYASLKKMSKEKLLMLVDKIDGVEG